MGEVISSNRLTRWRRAAVGQESTWTRLELGCKTVGPICSWGRAPPSTQPGQGEDLRVPESSDRIAASL